MIVPHKSNQTVCDLPVEQSEAPRLSELARVHYLQELLAAAQTAAAAEAAERGELPIAESTASLAAATTKNVVDAASEKQVSGAIIKLPTTKELDMKAAVDVPVVAHDHERVTTASTDVIMEEVMEGESRSVDALGEVGDAQIISTFE